MSLAEQLSEMGFEKNQIDSAVNIGKAANMEQAIDWITTHNNEITPGATASSEPVLTLSSSDSATATGAATANAQVEANSLKCDEIQERIVARRKEQQMADEKKAIDMEKKRISDGKTLLEIKQKREEDEMKKIAEANRREKLETQLAKQRAIEKIEADKRARREKAAAEKSGGVVGDVPAAKPQVATVPQPTRQYDECNLQIRLSDGSTVRHTFKAADRFEKVIEWIHQTHHTNPFVLVQNYPKKEFNESDNYKSLTELGLVPSGSLMMKSLAHFQT
ncbi:unnamed protein product [Rotaria socialis]|uniref:UBX domain-containing protein n=1 Tax=Rotaria socialis TaxID=392032 RepID=A0A821KG39_9BILA|nr:unnamed protein product [Rotaria socialis]